jgi:protein-S-isoprenylcysteine O-methyltransferase Ste14
MDGRFRQLGPLVLPFTVLLVVPFVLVFDFRRRVVQAFLPFPLLQPTMGVLLCAGGLLLLAVTMALIARLGKGTLAPWDPPTRLVIAGPYAHSRNPMISAVGLVLLGEATLLGSLPILIWFAVFVAGNTVYFKLSEEPRLVCRFGENYLEYRKNVPMWLPRIRPWRASSPEGT